MDVDLLEEVHTRLQFGRYIIDGKINSRPDLKDLLENYTPDKKEDVLKHILFKDQEEKVIKSALEYNSKMNLNLDKEQIPGLIKDFIRINTNIQFDHLRKFYDVDLGKL